MSKLHTFPCGCSFPILQERDGDIPFLDFKVREAPISCPAVWDMLARGLTKGIFQLESNFGRQWTMELAPETVEQVCDLTAVLRPGALKAIDEAGVSMTKHYCNRKNNLEEVTYLHPSLEPILKDTFGTLCYQEQMLRIAQVVAGFDLQEADDLRRAAGKKDAEKMAKMKSLFLEKAKAHKVLNDKEAEEVFSYIEASQRYSFGKAHACSYGLTAYDTAVCKVHNPPAFFAAWIKNAPLSSSQDRTPGDVRAELINEAKLMDVDVVIPDFKKFERFTAVEKGVVRLGLSDIKGMGEATLAKLVDAVRSIPEPPSQWSWSHVICKLAPLVSTSTLILLARSGSLHRFGVDRKRAAFEFEQLNELSEAEWAWVATQPLFETTSALFRAVGKTRKEGGGCATKKRAEKIAAKASLLENPPFSLSDTPIYLLTQEVELFGCGVSLTRVDTCDNSDINCSCKEFLDGMGGNVILGVEIKQVRPTTIKKGKNAGLEMAWLTVGDSTAEIRDVALFAEMWAQFSSIVAPNKTVYLLGEQDKKRKGTILVKNLWPMAALSSRSKA